MAPGAQRAPERPGWCQRHPKLAAAYNDPDYVRHIVEWRREGGPYRREHLEAMEVVEDILTGTPFTWPDFRTGEVTHYQVPADVARRNARQSGRN